MIITLDYQGTGELGSLGIHVRLYSKNHKCLIRIMILESSCPCGWSKISSTSSSHRWLMVSWKSCPIPVSVGSVADISSSICSHIVSGYSPSCNPLNPGRQERADLYSSGPCGRKGGVSGQEYISVFVFRIYISVYMCMSRCVHPCENLYVWWAAYFSFTHWALPKLISLFMREESGKRRQMKT